MREQSHIIPNPRYRELPKYPKGSCKYCGESSLPKFRRYYCDDICGTNYRIHSPIEITEWWPEFRERILKRDEYTCLDCGYMPNHLRKPDDRDWSDNRTMAVHHIVPISKGGPMWDEDNVETLCAEKCHKFKHRCRALEPTPESKQAFLDRYVEEDL